MSIEEAVKIVKNNNLVPIYAYEGSKYFVFVVTDENGEAVGNNSAFVVDKNKKTGDWVAKSEFPLDDDGNTFKEYEF